MTISHHFDDRWSLCQGGPDRSVAGTVWAVCRATTPRKRPMRVEYRDPDAAGGTGLDRADAAAGLGWFRQRLRLTGSARKCQGLQVRDSREHSLGEVLCPRRNFCHQSTSDKPNRHLLSPRFKSTRVVENHRSEPRFRKLQTSYSQPMMWHADSTSAEIGSGTTHRGRFRAFQ